MEASGRACTQEIRISDRIVCAGGRRQCFPVRPFHFNRGDGEKQRAGEIPFSPDTGLRDRLLANQSGHALAELGRAEWLDRDEIDGTGDGRFESFIREARDATDPRLARNEPCPVVLFAHPEGSDHPHSGDDHIRTTVCCHADLFHHIASIKPMPSPRQWPTEVTAI